MSYSVNEQVGGIEQSGEGMGPPTLGRQMTSLMDHEGSSSPQLALFGAASKSAKPMAPSPVVRALPHLKAKLRSVSLLGGGGVLACSFG